MVTNPSDVYIMMSSEDTYDITLINAIEVLLQKLRSRQTDKKRMYRLEQVNTSLMVYESMYVGCIPEEYAEKAEAFDDILNLALQDLNVLSKG